jgi:hypothetical protein
LRTFYSAASTLPAARTQTVESVLVVGLGTAGEIDPVLVSEALSPLSRFDAGG